MIKKILLIVLVLVLILPVAFSCSAVNSAELGLVPGTANVVLQIQVSKVFSNPALQIVYAELASMNTTLPQTTGDLLNLLKEKTGFDFSTISNAVFFADLESANQTQNMYAGAIVSGTFDESSLVEQLQQQTKQTLTTSDYKGLTVYSGGQDKFGLVFLTQNELVFGSLKAVQDVIDVSKKDQQPLKGSVIDTLKRVGTALISGAVTPPESLRNKLPGEAEVMSQYPVSLKPFQDIDAIGFAIDQPGLNLTARIDAHFANNTSLQDARDTITGLISLAKGTVQEQTVKTILSNIKVSTSGGWLSIQDLVSVTDFTSLFSNMQTTQP
jgi:hypothetical protein